MISLEIGFDLLDIHFKNTYDIGLGVIGRLVHNT